MEVMPWKQKVVGEGRQVTNNLEEIFGRQAVPDNSVGLLIYRSAGVLINLGRGDITEQNS